MVVLPVVRGMPAAGSKDACNAIGEQPLRCAIEAVALHISTLPENITDPVNVVLDAERIKGEPPTIVLAVTAVNAAYVPDRVLLAVMNIKAEDPEISPETGVSTLN